MAARRQFEHYRHAPELFEVRRSWPRTLAAALLALGLAAAAVALVVLWDPVVDLLEPPGSARYRSPELAVLGGILLSLLLGALAVRSARSGSNRIVHRPTGLPVRRRFEARLALPESAAEPLRAAIERGDARRWSPLPPRAADGLVVLEVRAVRGGDPAWAAISVGPSDRPRPLPLVELHGPAARALARVGRPGGRRYAERHG